MISFTAPHQRGFFYPQIMKYIYYTSIFALLISCSPKKTDSHADLVPETVYEIWVGSYTDSDNSDIYQLLLDSALQPVHIKEFGQLQNPSYIAWNPQDSLLIAVNEHPDTIPGEISTWRLKGDRFTMVNKVPSQSLYPCYFEVHNNTIYLANYGGSIAQFKVDGNYKLQLLKNQIHTGSGTTSRQLSAHPHMITKVSDNQFLVTDLGTDHLYQYDSNLELIDSLALPAGSGPRHLTVRNDKIYVSLELSSEVAIISFDNQKLGSVVQQINTLETPDSTTENYVSAIKIQGQYLYVGNRGHNSISVYQIQEDGTLEMTQIIQGNVIWPRDFSFTPDGKFLIAGNQKDNSLSVFIRNTDGSLNFSHKIPGVYQPSHVLVIE